LEGRIKRGKKKKRARSKKKYHGMIHCHPSRCGISPSKEAKGEGGERSEKSPSKEIAGSWREHRGAWGQSRSSIQEQSKPGMTEKTGDEKGESGLAKKGKVPSARE